MTATTAPASLSTSTSPTGAQRNTWAYWGVAAGFAGVLTNMAGAQTMGADVRSSGDAARIVDELSRPLYHLNAITGFTAVACLLFFAAGLARWGRQQTSDTLTLRVAPAAITASAGALIAAYGVKGMLAAYLPGGFNESSYEDGARYLFFLMDDLSGYYGWWGVAIALGCLAHLAFRERLVARWIGVLGGLAVLGPVLFLAAFGFSGFSGIIAPVMLVPIGIGLARSRA